MYPSRELRELAALKADLRQRVSQNRTQSIEATHRVVQPLAWIDQALLVWRQLSPLARCAAASIGLLLHRTASPHPRTLSTVLRWGPVVVDAVRLGADFARSAAPAVGASNGRG